MKLGTVGVNLGNVEAYRAALKGLSVEQSIFALASKGATEEQIRQILVTDQAKLKDVEAAMAKAGLTTATKALNAEELITLATKKGISTERAKEIASALGLIATEKGQIVSKKQLTVATLQQVGATDAEIKAILGLNAVETANIGITNVLTASFTKLWAVITAHPIGAILTAIGVVAIGAVAAYNKWGDTLENTKEKLSDLKSECQEIVSDLQAVNSELETTQQRLEELEGKDTLTFTEKEEYDNLVKINNELQRKIDLLELEEKNKRKEQNKTFVSAMEKDTENPFEHEVNPDGKKPAGQYSISDEYLTSETGYINAQFEIREQLLDDLANAETEKEKERIQKRIDEINSYLEDKNTEWKTVSDGIDYIKNPTTEDDKAVNEWLDYIADFQDRMAIAMSKDDASSNAQYKTNTFNRIVDNWQFDETVQGLQDLGKEGKVTAEMLNDPKYDEFINKLVFLGVIDSADNLEDVALAFNSVANSAENATDATGDFTDKTDISFPTISKTISDLEDLNKELDNLGTAIANIDTEGKFDLGDLDSIADYFLGLEDVPYDIEAVNNALKSLGDGNASLEEQTDSINTLADQYLKTSGILDTLTQSNRNLIQVQLERMGIVNAEEIVTAALNEQTELQALNNQFLAATGYELVNASYAEIQAFLDECNASDAARQEISKLALAKLDLSSFHYDSSVDVQNIVNLANAAGAGAEQIATFQAAMNALNSSSRTKQDWGYQVLSQIKNGTYDWGYEKLDANKFKATYTQVPKAIYNGGANVQKALDDANKAASSSAKETEDTYEELFDFFERRIEVLNDALDLLKSNLENVVGADAKNTLIDAQIGINKESINNYTDALAMYTQKANEALAKIPAEFQSKTVDGSVSMTDFIGSGNEDLVDAINEYKDWAGKISDCKKELADLKQALEDLELEKFNNIVDDFTNQFNIRDNSKDLIDKQIDLFKEAGQMIGQGFYQGLINESEGQLAILQQEKAKLVAQMNSALDSGNVEAGSEAWLSMVDSLSEVDSKIIDCKKDIEEFNNSIQELHWEVVERIQKNFDGISDEIKNIIGLIDEVDVSDAEGVWSKEGLTQLGLYAQEYEKAIYAANMYSQEIEQLNQAYIRGEYSATEYSDKLSELKDAQWDEINASESAKDAIMDLNKARIDIMVKAIEEEIDAMKELIDSKKEALDVEQD